MSQGIGCWWLLEVLVADVLFEAWHTGRLRMHHWRHTSNMAASPVPNSTHLLYLYRLCRSRKKYDELCKAYNTSILANTYSNAWRISFQIKWKLESYLSDHSPSASKILIRFGLAEQTSSAACLKFCCVSCHHCWIESKNAGGARIANRLSLSKNKSELQQWRTRQCRATVSQRY